MDCCYRYIPYIFSKLDTHFQPEKSHNKEKILCGYVAPYEESFRILKYALGVAKNNEMSGTFKINRGTLKISTNIDR